MIVTGGASGLGEACARHFAAAGDHVFMLDIDGERANAVAGEITATGAGRRQW